MIVTAFIFSNTKGEKVKPNENPPTEDVKKEKETIDNNFLSSDTNQEIIKNTTGKVVTHNNIYVGKDSYVSYYPTDDIIKKYNLQEYQKLQKKYAAIVEKRYQSKTTYNIKKSGENQLIYTFKPWYYGAYSSDLQQMTQTLIT